MRVYTGSSSRCEMNPMSCIGLLSFDPICSKEGYQLHIRNWVGYQVDDGNKLVSS
jgi:hypothetical protein